MSLLRSELSDFQPFHLTAKCFPIDTVAVTGWSEGMLATAVVKALLVARWPHGKVHLFGSTANNLSICNTNDIDVCLELPDLRDDQEQVSCCPLIRCSMKR